MRNFFIALLCALAASLYRLPASAQTIATGFALDRYEPIDPGSSWLALDSVDFRGGSRPAVGLTVDYARKPLVLTDALGGVVRPVIDNQLFAHLAASVVFGERVRFGLNLPLLPFVSGAQAAAGETEFRVKEQFSLGDLRLSADVRLAGEHLGPFGLSFGTAVWLPTGRRPAFTGDGKFRLEPRVQLAGAVARFRYALRLGFRYRARDDSFSGGDLGSEITFGAGAGIVVAEGLTIGPEVFGGTVLSGGPFRPEGTPLEALLGVHYESPRGPRYHLGGGPGLTQGLGSPEVRVVASVAWAKPTHGRRIYQPVKVRGHDADRDGVPDGADACPHKAGVLSDDPSKQGCPPSDVDQDGIVDTEDACPSAPGARSADSAKNGCVVRDRDKDGVEDDDDACPDKQGPATANPRTSGCTDSDGDSIFDPLDACPTVVGPPNFDAEKSGCPIARIEAGQIRIIDQVQFRSDSAELMAAGEDVLRAVLRVLLDHPEISLLSVEGHTDSAERARRSLKLSKRRVAAVLTWLVQNGISPTRLTSVGYGSEQPLDTNLTEEGRAKNRRVEFHIRALDGRPVDAQGKSP